MSTILTRKKEKILASKQDIPTLSNYTWHINGGYARTRVGDKIIKMHRLLLNAPSEKEVDHINGNPLDNRRENLRLVTHSQNQANRKVNKTSASGLKGVCYNRFMQRQKRWKAHIYHAGKRTTIGHYYTKEEAARAYDDMAIKLKGKFARTNGTGETSLVL